MGMKEVKDKKDFALPEIVLIGLNHKTASVELRECIAFSEEEAATTLEALHGHPVIREVILFSTCNRVEVLLVSDNRSEAVETAKRLISEYKTAPIDSFDDALYIHVGDKAIRHIFRVVSSLDSMMVGEPQILGQIKGAYRAATEIKTSGVILNRLLHRAFAVAKRIRTETGIGDHAVSISYAAIELGRKIFGTLGEKKVLLIGAGEMAELAMEHLLRNSVGEIFVSNRTFERGLELARKFNGQAIQFEEIENCLQCVDIIISSTGSPDFIITRDQVKKAIRKRRNCPIFFIDIAVPRDIDPKINRLTNTYVYDIDDLKGVIDENIKDRNREAVKGERIIDENVIQFRHWYNNLDVVSTIVALRNKLDDIARVETKKTLQSLNHLSETDCETIRRMTNAFIKKILHDPTLFLKSHTKHDPKTICLDVTRKLFKLDE